MPSISIPYDRYPDLPIEQVARRSVHDPRYFAVVAYKSRPDAPQATNFGLCEIEQHLHMYLASEHCHDPVVIWLGR